MCELNRHEQTGSRELHNGCALYWHPNQVGGRTYLSDEVGGGIFVWDTALVDAETLRAALEVEAFMEGKIQRLHSNLPAEDALALRLVDKAQALHSAHIDHRLLQEEVTRLNAFIKTISAVAEREKKQAMIDGFRTALLLGNNICIQESGRANADDRPQATEAAEECASQIRKWLPAGEEAVLALVEEYRGAITKQADLKDRIHEEFTKGQPAQEQKQ